MIISNLSQKGGVGKSSLSRTIAVELTRAGWDVLLADIDPSQRTVKNWSDKRRDTVDIEPKVKTQDFKVTSKALVLAGDFDLLVIDGAPHATQGTLDAAKVSDMVILPTGTSIDDLEPQIGLAAELVSNGVERERIWFVIFKTSSDAETRGAIDAIREYNFNVFDEAIAHKTSYSQALDRGYCLTETRVKSLNEKAGLLIKAVVKKITE
ncbi:AAA family ATPase [Colwellia sp. MB3u-70]|jgi:chromosome partitioning protein|uniref:nucleotide-binding protein n=1 Tax=unclassified Colwellia TaxID=196834 RepID=UPI0015F574AF|nr:MULTISPECIES: AAA family ATPase [unclassified Colwellia]MBA6291586.1 AAA family ATPase [Colwellia sp. MB3u-8]MBA6306289.1 AAA family ATPase [Colwellia sp. MB3u-70]